MEVFKRYKKEIVISLITGVVVFYFEPVLTYLGQIVINAFVLISERFSSFYYKTVALNEPDGFSQITNLQVIYAFFLFMLFYFVIGQRRRWREFKSYIAHDIETLKKRKAKLTGTMVTNDDEDREAEALESDPQAIQNEIDRLQSILQDKPKKLWPLYLPSVLLFVVLILQHATILAVNRENIKFRNELIKLAPHVADIELKKLHAAWAEMENRQGYQRVNAQLEKYKEQYKRPAND